MESLEWRTKQLEDKLPGSINLDQLIQVSKAYRNFIETNGERYRRFLELKDILNVLTIDSASDASPLTKAELVLAYEDDLVKHLENVKILAEKADKVLDIRRWPDLSGFEKRLEKLETITRDQHLQSVTVDSQVEDLIMVYNEIIESFRRNAARWNQALDAYEMEDKKIDEDD